MRDALNNNSLFVWAIFSPNCYTDSNTIVLTGKLQY